MDHPAQVYIVFEEGLDGEPIRGVIFQEEEDAEAYLMSPKKKQKLIDEVYVYNRADQPRKRKRREEAVDE